MIFALICSVGSAAADELKVAVAANFAVVAQEVSRQFEEKTGHTATLVFGSTGKHYAQIHNGAPFDVFMAADSERPRLLEEQRKTVAGSRFTYAFGHIALWSATGGLVKPGGEVLRYGEFRRLAIADPNLAPYGRAAREALIALGHWENLQPRIVRGKNVNQAFQFVKTGNAELGIVAVSQIPSVDSRQHGSVWVIPGSLYAPIEQQAVLLRESLTGRSFLAFLNSEPVRAVIRANGYGTS